MQSIFSVSWPESKPPLKNWDLTTTKYWGRKENSGDYSPPDKANPSPHTCFYSRQNKMYRTITHDPYCYSCHSKVVNKLCFFFRFYLGKYHQIPRNCENWRQILHRLSHFSWWWCFWNDRSTIESLFLWARIVPHNYQKILLLEYVLIATVCAAEHQ